MQGNLDPTREASTSWKVTIVGSNPVLAELLANEIGQQGHRASWQSDPSEAAEQARRVVASPPDLILIDTQFQGTGLNGLDVMMAYRRWSPETALLVYTDAPKADDPLLRVIWEAIPPAGVVSSSAPLADLIATMHTIMQHGVAAPDPTLRPYLPEQRSPWRSMEAYERLVPHAGHAKLWRALLSTDTAPSYKKLAESAGLKPNTIRNYRSDLLGELRLHGLEQPTMAQIHAFAHLVRPLLHPHVAHQMAYA